MVDDRVVEIAARTPVYILAADVGRLEVAEEVILLQADEVFLFFGFPL